MNVSFAPEYHEGITTNNIIIILYIYSLNIVFASAFVVCTWRRLGR